MRVGGFGGVDGLRTYLRDHTITHVIDATHPFAAQMSRHAVAACAAEKVELAALVRRPWQPEAGDQWTHVADVDAAVAALDDGPAQKVMLALGRLNMAAFAAQPRHHYVLRLVDAPDSPPPLPHHSVVVARGPFDVAGDIALFREHGVEIVVCKNAGGSGAVAKLTAARELDLPVVMIDRPELPERLAFGTVEAVLIWVDAN